MSLQAAMNGADMGEGESTQSGRLRRARGQSIRGYGQGENIPCLGTRQSHPERVSKPETQQTQNRETTALEEGLDGVNSCTAMAEVDWRQSRLKDMQRRRCVGARRVEEERGWIRKATWWQSLAWTALRLSHRGMAIPRDQVPGRMEQEG